MAHTKTKEAMIGNVNILYTICIHRPSSLFNMRTSLLHYFMKAAKTAHMTSLAFSLAASASKSRSRRSRTLFIATS